jgi:hypothetical protein
MTSVSIYLLLPTTMVTRSISLAASVHELRTSRIVRRSNSLAGPAKLLRLTLIRPAIPPMATELLDRIVAFMLSATSSTRVPRPNFSFIASFSLVSSRFRQIALRRYFSELQLWSVSHWTRLWHLLSAQGEEAFAWVRYVDAKRSISLDIFKTKWHSNPECFKPEQKYSPQPLSA